MKRHFDPFHPDSVADDRSGFWVRSVYYGIILSLGLMLFLVIYLAR